jgi:hypothetical protein
MNDHAVGRPRACRGRRCALTLVREILETLEHVLRLRSALAVLEEQSPDVLIPDLGMPGMDGLADSRVRTLTIEGEGHPGRVMRRARRRQGAPGGDHLAPIDPPELVAAVVSLARRRSGATRQN